MPESRTVAIVLSSRAELARLWTAHALQVMGHGFQQAAEWAADVAQQFGSLLSALMGPAVVSAYAFAGWSLAGNLGWTDSFVFNSGALSNWFVWLGVAVLVNIAAGILRRRTQADEESEL